MARNGFVKVLMFVAAVAIVTVGCAKKPKLNLAHLRDGANGGAGVTDVAEPFSPDGVTASEDFGGGAANFEGGNGGNGAAGEWGAANAPANIGGAADNFLVNAQPFSDKVYFDYNRYEIKSSQRPVLDKLAEALTGNNKGLVIEGHCDERGSAEYNRSLSERRALAIRDYLKALGIDTNRMHTISYGVDRPEIPNATTEEQHRLNRRGQFLIGDIK